ncbi:MAG: 2-succinyl-5-enolpyruvyl-6-hydroxy-3-cyclohexene-1-carboxylic-acid synthase [Rhodocyclales bacterium GT-UBC]|nr:MAG: 2-succinyl-5-enolpyruvyl-6-hydroxy-3-cyclohexene-1-carboxylic-acid synthase [Rhodocyclales bacterium GT-UBC]
MNQSIEIANLNYRWSQALVGGLVAAGVQRTVISPGARSTPLALAMLRHPGLSSEIVVDERCAAFLALGMAKASRRPVAVLATSGTAVGNWLPAVIEASLAGIPLILISADRPPALLGLGANQTIPQVGIFGQYVRACHALGSPEPGFAPASLTALAARVVEQASWPHPGPVHINQPFQEPLVPSLTELPSAPPLPIPIRVAPAELHPDPASIDELAKALSGRPGAIICGEMPATPGFAQAVTQLAERLNCPILAEPLSNLRFGPHPRHRISTHYSRWLGDSALAGQAEWILRFGAVPVTRKLQDMLARHSGLMALADPWPRWNDPNHRLTHLLRCTPDQACQALLSRELTAAPPDWFARWQAAESAGPIDDSANAQLIRHFIAALPAGCPVFVGASLAIRKIDAYSDSGERPLCFFANRGASGIDGNISSALGIAIEHGRVVALLGDLTTLHDIGGLANAGGRDAVIVVVNNGGGGIFKELPQATLPEVERGWLTPQHIDFKSAAATFDIGYAQTTTDRGLTDTLHRAITAGGPHLIEVIL